MAGNQISPTCEVIMSWHEPIEFCGLPTVAGYDAMDGGWMALCAIHNVRAHDSYVFTVEDIRSGLADSMQANRNRG
jgi:hypothetical protein